jgi:hypothetical protein
MIYLFERCQDASISTMSTGDIVTISLAAFFAAVGLLVQWINYHRHLRMDATYLQVLDVSKGTSVFLLRLLFVNNSSVGRVIYDIVPEDKLENITLKKPQYTFDLSGQNVIYHLPTSEKLTLPISEVSILPVHIPPHQNLSIWYCMELTVNPTVSYLLENYDSDSEIGDLVPHENKLDYDTLKNSKQKIQLNAISIERKKICSFEKEISLFQKQSVSLFEAPSKRKFIISFPDFTNDPSFVFFLIFLIFWILVLYLFR